MYVCMYTPDPPEFCLPALKMTGRKEVKVMPTLRHLIEELLNLMLDKFILYGNGKIELRFKVPVNNRQVAEKIQELSCGVLVS